MTHDRSNEHDRDHLHGRGQAGDQRLGSRNDPADGSHGHRHETGAGRHHGRDAAGDQRGHSHDHSHGHHHTLDHPIGQAIGRGPVLVTRASERRRLKAVLAVTGLFMVVEAVGGVLANSLALLADAGHMLTDVAALALALFAMRLAQRPPSPDKTFGYVRLEVLAALVNGAALLVIAIFICWEAYERLVSPPSVDGPLMLGVATVGLAVNVFGAFALHGHAHENLNLRGAYLHVLGDLLGSVGAIAAGLIILFTGWVPADAVFSVLIAALILTSAWRLVREATDVLLEAAPPHIDVEELLADLGAIPGLENVHDLHVWTLTSGFVALSAHGVVDDPRDQARILEEVEGRAAARGIDHVTFQLEPRRLYQIPAREGTGTTP